ncbi:MAG: MarR family winged helix-turn-helix transcriptional regulator [Ferruginibacter sp.]
MSLEQDIKQPKFRTEHQKVIINLIYSYNWMNERLKVFFEKEDITQQQFNILRILRGAAAPLSTSQIRQRMLDKMSDTSRIVDRLITKAFVKKITCPLDKRMVDVTITAKGQKLLEKLDAFELTMDEVAGSLTEADAKMLNKLLDKMREEQE